MAAALEVASSPLSSCLCSAAGTLTSLSGSVTDKGANCRRLKDQLDTLEKETTDKLAQMDQYNKELKVSEGHVYQDLGCVLVRLSHLSD